MILNKELPFIKLFKSPYNYYIYDVNTNSILSIEKKYIIIFIHNSKEMVKRLMMNLLLKKLIN